MKIGIVDVALDPQTREARTTAALAAEYELDSFGADKEKPPATPAKATSAAGERAR